MVIFPRLSRWTINPFWNEPKFPTPLRSMRFVDHTLVLPLLLAVGVKGLVRYTKELDALTWSENYNFPVQVDIASCMIDCSDPDIYNASSFKRLRLGYFSKSLAPGSPSSPYNPILLVCPSPPNVFGDDILPRLRFTALAISSIHVIIHHHPNVALRLPTSLFG